MPNFKIDNVAMTYQPTYWRVIPPESVDYPAAGYNRIVVQPETPPLLEVRWGQEGTYPALISEVKTKRGRDLVHALSWPDEANLKHKHCNVFFPEIPSGQGPASGVVDVLSLTFKAFNPLPGLVIIDLFRPGVITVADGWQSGMPPQADGY